MPITDHLKRLVRQLGWRSGAVLGLLLATGVLEGAGLLLLVPLLAAVGVDTRQGSVGHLAVLVRRGFAIVGLAPTLARVLAVFVIVNVLTAAIRRAQAILAAALEQQVVCGTAERLYTAIVRMNWLAFSRMRASDLTVALTSECERVGLAASQLLSVFASVVVAAVYVVLAFRVSPSISLAVFASGAAIVLLLRRRTRVSGALGHAHADAVREYQAAVTDDLGGMKVIRAFVAEDRSAARFSAVARGIERIRVESSRNYANAGFWVDVSSVAALSVLVFVAISILHFDAASLLMLMFLFVRIVPRLASLQHNVTFYANVLPSVQRLAALERACGAAAEPERRPAPPLPLRSRLELRSVAFGYQPDQPPTLSGVDLTIRAGDVAAIVGPSGAGKTTLADLVMGLLTPASGALFVDGEALDADRLPRWRESIAYVAQDTFLFHDTIRANLLWAAPSATDADIAGALAMASAGFVDELPEGLATVVGDRGLRLSGGERQRLALARALLRRPSLLVLDEATSALDPENERRVFEALARLRGSITILLVTHRLATVSVADVVHVVDGGRLVQSGTWEALAADAGGRFNQLRDAQRSLGGIREPVGSRDAAAV